MEPEKGRRAQGGTLNPNPNPNPKGRAKKGEFACPNLPVSLGQKPRIAMMRARVRQRRTRRKADVGCMHAEVWNEYENAFLIVNNSSW